MKAFVQWTAADPRDWVEIDTAQWAALPKLPEPATPSGGDNRPGLVCGLNIQGVSFDGDHYAIEDLPDGSCRVTVWNDDPEDYPPGWRSARVWTFRPLFEDPERGHAWNARPTKAIYVGDDIRRAYDRAKWNPAELRPWSGFAPPDPHFVRHGAWLPDRLYEGHWRSRSLHGWREWTEGVPDDMVRRGRVVDQRSLGRYNVPDGTKTYYHSDTPTQVIGGGVVAEFEQTLATATGTVATQTSASLSGGADSAVWGAVTPSGEPNSAAWPSGISNYRHQIDCSAVGADITFGLLTLGGSVGRFIRINDALGIIQESRDQAEAAFSGTGLHLATATGANWSAGNAADRFGIVIAAVRGANHGNQTISIDVNEADDFADGPWTTAAPTATAGQTIPTPGQAATGTETFTGAADQTAPTPSQAATGTESIPGAAAQTAPPPAQAATAFIHPDGAAAQDAPVPAQAATGTETIPGAAAQTAPPPSQAATAFMHPDGAAVQALPTPSQTATGVHGATHTGVAAQQAPVPSQAATGEETIGGVAAQAAPTPGQAATGAHELLGGAAQTAPIPSQAATGAHAITVTGSAAQTTPTPAQAASGAHESIGAAAQTAPTPVQAAAGDHTQQVHGATAAQAVSAPTQAAVGAQTLDGLAAQLLPGLIQSATGILLPDGVAAQLMPTPVQAATGVIPTVGLPGPGSVDGSESVPAVTGTIGGGGAVGTIRP